MAELNKLETDELLADDVVVLSDVHIPLCGGKNDDMHYILMCMNTNKGGQVFEDLYGDFRVSGLKTGNKYPAIPNLRTCIKNADGTYTIHEKTIEQRLKALEEN